ncbi:MAG: hypothetical protein EBV86_18680 [Marivivens sp.]|nr:hypothetical protein [Marivivens sp.]
MKELYKMMAADDMRPTAKVTKQIDGLVARYNKDSVDQAIKTSRQKITGKEAKAIHALLKGRG